MIARARSIHPICPWLAAAVAAAVAGVAGPAQDRPLGTGDPIGGLASASDPVAIEAARRRLLLGPAQALDTRTLLRLCRHAESRRRWAAATVLLHHGKETATLRALLLADQEPDLRVLALPSSDGDELRQVVAQDPSAAVRCRAIEVLADHGELDAELLGRLVAGGEGREQDSETAVRILVEEISPLPETALRAVEARAAARRRLLEALADRPRNGAFDWLERQLDAGALTAAERLIAFLALPAARIDPARGREILDALESGDPELRRFALRCADLLPQKTADLLVSDVHRRAVSGGDLEDILSCVGRMSEKGERHLLALALALTPEQREAIANWLAARGSSMLDEIVVGALRGSYPLEPYLLRRAGPHLGDAERRAEVVRLLADETGDAELRLAAFQALLDAGRFDDAMLDFALCEDGTRAKTRVRLLMALSPDGLPDAAIVAVLDRTGWPLSALVLGALQSRPLSERLVQKLLRIAGSQAAEADLAARLLIARAERPVVERSWRDLPVARRRSLAGAFVGRDGDWILPLLQAEDPAPTHEVWFARLWFGDRRTFERLLDDPAAWPIRWLRRCSEAAPRALRADDVARLERLLTGAGRVDAERRVHLASWLAARPELDGAIPLLARVHAEDPDVEVRDEALRGLLAGPTAGAFRARILAAIPAGLDEAQTDLGYEILGTMQSPIGADDALLLARLLLVEPLGHPHEELALHLPGDGDPVLPGLGIVNIAWRLCRDVVLDEAVAAFETAAAEALAHDNAYAAGRRRLGRLLAVLCQQAASRRALGPTIARLILRAPDPAEQFLGPAWLILAERAERDQDWRAAAAAWTHAVHHFRRTPPDHLTRRVFLGDENRGGGRLPDAALAARPHLCRARAAIAASDFAAARAALALAEDMAVGDDGTERELRALQQEIDR